MEREPDEREPIEELEEEAAAHNPDATTRREAFELELMEEGRSAEGAEVGDVDEVEPDGEARDADDEGAPA